MGGERFAKWDWSLIPVNEAGIKIESDPRRRVQQRMQDLFWQANNGHRSRLAQFLARQSAGDQAEWNKQMRSPPRGGGGGKRRS